MEEIIFFDTTLRDGEQSPGASMTKDGKVKVAMQLEKLGVNVIEAGFPIASENDFESVKEIARTVTKSTVAGLARAKKVDIDRCGDAIKDAKKPRIHTFMSTSDIHLANQFGIDRETALKISIDAVKQAKNYCNDIEFSPMDATRTEKSYLYRVIESVIDAGATTVNIPDTVGYSTPVEFGQLIKGIKENVPNISQAIISVHCHNDLGLATANSLAAITNGARQVEGTINGIGERAGNASLEEIMMILKTRKDQMGEFKSNVNYTEIYNSSKIVESISGIMVQRNKAIVGKNAFSHESGIHQDGIIKHKSTYEIIDPRTIGIESELVLGKHSGKHAIEKRAKEIGFEIDENQMNCVFTSFKNYADNKKYVTDEELEKIIVQELGIKQNA
ncbi:MAG: 2-isopropylmalate synthase [Candidatus ainarchaeum sp.]|nr:2-isopropylmalate synthase [Candidatus ainarchaeum sp.]